MSNQTNISKISEAQNQVKSSLFTSAGLFKPAFVPGKQVAVSKHEPARKSNIAAKMSLQNFNEHTSGLFKGENLNQQIQSKSDFQMVASQPQAAKIFTSASLKTLVSSHNQRQSVKMMAVASDKAADVVA